MSKKSDTQTANEVPFGENVPEVASPAPFVPKIKRHVTLPLLSLKDGQVAYIQIKSKIEISSKKIEQKEGKAKEPPYMAQVVNLETGELCEMIFNTVLYKNIFEQYKNDSYVEKGFMILRRMPDGKRGYALFDITEIEV